MCYNTYCKQVELLITKTIDPLNETCPWLCLLTTFGGSFFLEVIMKKPWVSEQNKRRVGKLHPLFGKERTESTKSKISEKKKGAPLTQKAIEGHERGAVTRSGYNHYGWNGGKFIEKDGYRKILKPEHPNAQKTTGYILEHRYVVEKYLGRLLYNWEDVHHINSIRTDNRIRNLMVFSSRSAHRRYHYNPRNVKQEEIVFNGRS